MSISRNYVNILMIFTFSFFLVMPAWGISGQRRLRIPLSASPEEGRLIDSIAKTISGVKTAKWYVRRQHLFLVYDRTITNQKVIITTLMQKIQNKNINFATEQMDEVKKKSDEENIDG